MSSDLQPHDDDDDNDYNKYNHSKPDVRHSRMIRLLAVVLTRYSAFAILIMTLVVEQAITETVVYLIPADGPHRMIWWWIIAVSVIAVFVLVYQLLQRMLPDELSGVLGVESVEMYQTTNNNNTATINDTVSISINNSTPVVAPSSSTNNNSLKKAILYSMSADLTQELMRNNNNSNSNSTLLRGGGMHR